MPPGEGAFDFATDSPPMAGLVLRENRAMILQRFDNTTIQ